jgi:hypothetical protein
LLGIFLVVSKQFLFTFFPVSNENENEQQTRVHWLRLKLFSVLTEMVFAYIFPVSNEQSTLMSRPKSMMMYNLTKYCRKFTQKNQKHQIFLSYLHAIYGVLKKLVTRHNIC